MRDGAPGDVRKVDDIRALTALGHPDRVRLMDALAVGGTATTSSLAQTLGLATGSISHHIKVLAEAGLVQRDESGTDRRESRWRLVTRGTRFSVETFRGEAAGETAAVAADGVYLARQFEQARTFLEHQQPPWDAAAYAGHFWLRLTPAELRAFGEELNELLLRWRRREIPDDGATDRRLVLALARAFPADP